MSEVRGWLSSRRPSPPPELSEALNVDAEEGALHVRLSRAAVARLEQARANPGRDRASAFPLLAADALLTYACEAALERPDADEALLSLLDLGAAP